jgi:hypothetical protein
MIGKQKKLIIIFAAVIAVLLAGYFAVVVPMVNKAEPEETTEPLVTQAGEEVGINDRILMFPHIEKKGMQSIEVTNEFGTYTFYRDEEDNFQIDGYAGVPFNPELFSQLVVDCGYTLSKLKVMDDAPDDRIAEYGLDKASNPAKYTLTTIDNEKFTVYVGFPILSGGGYYCMLEGRKTVYVLGTTLGTTVLAKIEDFVTPLLTYGLGQQDYIMIERFALMKGDDKVIDVSSVSPEEQMNPDAMIEHRMTYPKPYTPSSTMFMEVLQKFVALQGESTAKLGITDEALDEYGLTEPEYSLYFKYQDIEYLILVSALQADGYYYAVSPLFDIIARMPKDTLNFLTWDLMKWIDLPIFQNNINLVESVSVTSPEVSETFYLEGEAQELLVHIGSPSGELTDTANFRQFYKVLLSITNENFTPEEQNTETIINDSNMQLEFKITLRDGTQNTYQFYPYSTRRSAISINGESEFYTFRDTIQKLQNDTKRVLSNEPIESYGKD